MPVTYGPDGGGARGDGPDPHGQAALLLVESLIHVLVEKGALTREEALDVVQTSTEVKTDIASGNSEPRAIAMASLALLKERCLSFELLQEAHRPGRDGDDQGRYSGAVTSRHGNGGESRGRGED